MRHPAARLAPLATTLAVAIIALLPSGAVAASGTLKCFASVTNGRPSHYSTTIVIVETAPNARVTVSAHYKTTSDTMSAKANSRGLTAVAYDVSDATSGFRVTVVVSVRLGGRSGQCQTSYVPV